MFESLTLVIYSIENNCKASIKIYVNFDNSFSYNGETLQGASYHFIVLSSKFTLLCLPLCYVAESCKRFFCQLVGLITSSVEGSVE